MLAWREVDNVFLIQPYATKVKGLCFSIKIRIYAVVMFCLVICNLKDCFPLSFPKSFYFQWTTLCSCIRPQIEISVKLNIAIQINGIFGKTFLCQKGNFQFQSYGYKFMINYFMNYRPILLSIIPYHHWEIPLLEV